MVNDISNAGVVVFDRITSELLYSDLEIFTTVLLNDRSCK